jgi:L-ascorbate metabolism protein UlaG (beta-lactamase superfamily)
MNSNLSPRTSQPARRIQRIPRSFKELTPSNHFHPGTFFYELLWKGWITKRTGRRHRPQFPEVHPGQVALTWIGHASFLLQFSDMNALVDPNFANWIFLLKRLRHAGCKIEDLPKIDLVLITHAHFDHFHRPSIRKLDGHHFRTAVVPWGMGDLAYGLGFGRIVELRWWESFEHRGWKVTLTPSQHWGARILHDNHRGFGGYLIEHQGRSIYHAGDSAYNPCFKEIGTRARPEVALLPIGAYYPDSFRRVHMGPDEALTVFQELQAQ